MRFLSQEWIEERSRQAAALAPTPGVDISIQYEVPDTPDGPVQYYDVVENGLLVRSGLGTLPDPDVTITAGWAFQLDLLRGRLDLFAILMSGGVQIKGNHIKLLSLAEVVRHQMLALAVIGRNMMDCTDDVE